MRTPIRKAGKYSSLKADPNITQEKYREIEANLRRLKEKIRPGLIKEVKRLATDGDFSENHAYSLAKGRLRGINQRILDLEDHLKRAVIIQPSNNREVGLGTTVKIELSGKTKTYTILGSSETDPAKNIISASSPLGSSLMGRKAGDEFSFSINDKSFACKIVSIK